MVNQQNNPYEKATNLLDQRSIEVINNRISVNEHIIIFMGQPNDIKSQHMINNLAEVINQLGMNQDIFYVDTVKRTNLLENFMAKFHIKSIPTLVVFNNAELDAEYQGNGDQNSLRDFIQSHR